jgi:plasmid stability protein
MKQLLLRVPDELHRRLTARAARDKRSVNALATEILDASTDIDLGDRRDRLRARATSLGVHRERAAQPVSATKRRGVLASTKGTGPVVDQLLEDERNRV